MKAAPILLLAPTLLIALAALAGCSHLDRTPALASDTPARYAEASAGVRSR